MPGIHLPGVAVAAETLYVLNASSGVYYIHVRDGIRLVGERPARRRAVAGEDVAGCGDLRRAPDDRYLIGKVRRVFSVLDSLNGPVDALAHGEAIAARRRVEAHQVIA